MAAAERILERRLIRRSRPDACATRVLFFPHGGLGDRVVFEAIVRHVCETSPRTRVVAVVPFHADQYDARSYVPGPDEIWVVWRCDASRLVELAARLQRAAVSSFAWSGPVELTCYGPPGVEASLPGARWEDPYAVLDELARGGVYPRFDVGPKGTAHGAGWRASLSEAAAPRAVIALHCRALAASPARNVDAASMAALARRLHEVPGVQVVATGSADLAPELLAVVDGAITGDDPRLELTAGCLARCDAFVGGESGPMHLAAAVGCRVVVVTSPERAAGRWGPFAPAPRVREVVSEARSASGALTFDEDRVAAVVLELADVRENVTA